MATPSHAESGVRLVGPFLWKRPINRVNRRCLAELLQWRMDGTSCFTPLALRTGNPTYHLEKKKKKGKTKKCPSSASIHFWVNGRPQPRPGRIERFYLRRITAHYVPQHLADFRLRYR